MSKIKFESGMEYEVARQLTPARAFVNYEGLFALADMDPQTGTWDLSGTPANPEEEVILKELTAFMNDKSILTVEKDE